ncbi:hypothetical protein [Arthrobacter sp. zg-Y877]|uniref:hypothetical protein n=1 Tax=Arthrobacter sp. zg-Y877 TaxID=3049074 RepID=UPI0025A46425|nr:hypothetical protein [Arthrobacter sp. zg-Y877]MDM7990703.1 hypothetical protein [Arthrobacter sp. zg-Y877]
MNKKYLFWVGALLVVLLVALVSGFALGRNSPTEPNPATALQAKTTAPVAPKVSPSVAPRTSSSPTPSPTSTSIAITYGCLVNGKVLQFESLEEVWDQPVPLTDCHYGTQSEGIPSELELAAIEAADYRLEGLDSLYSLCTVLSGPPIDKVFTAMQAKELEGAYMLCPNHPKATAIEASLAYGRTLVAAEDASKLASEEGRQVASGHYLVGIDIQPGTWETVLDKVTNCYWEVSDAQGNIIQNNFVSTAPRFSVDVPTYAAGLTLEGCAFRLAG